MHLMLFQQLQAGAKRLAPPGSHQGYLPRGCVGTRQLPLHPLHSPLWLWMGHHESLSCPDQVLFPQAWDGHGGDASDHHGQGEDADVRLGGGLRPPCLGGHWHNPR